MKKHIYKTNHKITSQKQTTTSIHTPLHAFCTSILIIENSDIKENLLLQYPDLRFHDDLNINERMALLTTSVTESLLRPIGNVFHKNRKNALVYESIEDFFSEVLTNDEHGIFYIIETGIRIRRITIDIEKIIGYVYIVIKNIAIKIATKNTTNINEQLTLENEQYIQAQFASPENHMLFQNSLYEQIPDTLDVIQSKLDKEQQHIEKQILPAHHILSGTINFNADIFSYLISIFYRLIQVQVDLLEKQVPDGLLLTTLNKFISFVLLNNRNLVSKYLLEHQTTFKRPGLEIYELWKSTKDIRNTIIEQDCKSQIRYRKYLTWLCFEENHDFVEELQLSSTKQDSFGKSVIRSYGDLSTGILISLVIGVSAPDIFDTDFNYPTQYKQSLFKTLGQSKNSLLSLKKIEEEEFLKRVKYFHQILRQESYLNALIELENIVYSAHKNQNFKNLFAQTKKEIQKQKVQNPDLSLLIMEMTRLFYSKDEESYSIFPKTRPSNLETRFLTKYLQFMLCLSQ
jgi:hypothetical protein